MTIKSLKSIAAREYNLSGENKKWWFSKIDSYPKNKWFSPNEKDKDYSCCRDMHCIGLCSMKIEPVWSNSSLVGTKISFKIIVTK